MSKILKFPEGFLWGSATASYQVEGGITNNDWAEAGRSGRVPEAGMACDQFNLYDGDFAIAKGLGQNAHRFSIEWARIEPEEGVFDLDAIEHYRRVITSLKEKGMEPFVTIYHWTLPTWFAKRGGWLAKDSPKIFARYAKKVAEEYKDIVNFWITINEPMVYAGGAFLKGKWPPFNKNIFKFLKVSKRLAMSHNMAYKEIKLINNSFKIGVAKNQIHFEHSWDPFTFILSKFLISFWNQSFLLKIKNSQDFIGLNYYFHKKLGIESKHEKSDLGWDIYPRGIYYVLMELKKYNKPVYITENGVADAKDLKRTKFIKEHLRWVYKAIQDKTDVRGYFHWSLLDNFEWAYGFEPRFGLIEMDYNTMERKIRPSAYEYKKISENNYLELN